MLIRWMCPRGRTAAFSEFAVRLVLADSRSSSDSTERPLNNP